MAPSDPLVKDVLPDLAEGLRRELDARGEHDLAAQIDELRMTACCRCRDLDCGSFYTAPRMAVDHSLLLDDPPGWVAIDIADDRIVYVEILNWTAARDRVVAVFPSSS